ncbi:TetR family transcriptional regulator [Listeria booriae]|uniref:TetR/AcrR family transcriptional regulator C-terminal domain-containing protein n=1 Tax=Listeria booriae TaxID=1552123 RepID=UPI00162A0C83|nr:TetR/AcrR family transcriptional regulator C-terminal domain-containing protein [Listeria booriae]MBC1291232.1 TetR family transcriptional regulator [Listeria booriae]MBC1333848.1 TetR family transcriptional regulator [Listeria booriae]
MSKKRNLTQEKIILASLEVLEKHGIQNLSMRKVADAMNVQAPALYWHFKNKQDLLQGLSSYISAQIALPDAELSWQDKARWLAMQSHQAMRAVPDGAEIMMKTIPIDKSRLNIIDCLFCAFFDAGFDEEQTLALCNLIDNYVTGIAIDETSQDRTLAEVGPDKIHGLFTSMFEREDMQHLRVIPAMKRHAEAHERFDLNFSFGLNVIIAGAEKILETTKGS